MTRKIVFYTDARIPGGAERALLTLLAGLATKNWELALVYHPQPAIDSFVDEARRLGVRLLPVEWGVGGRVNRAAAEIPAVVRYLRAERPTVLHANMTWPVGCRYGFRRVGSGAGRGYGAPARERSAPGRFGPAACDRRRRPLHRGFGLCRPRAARSFPRACGPDQGRPNGISHRFFERAPPLDLRTILADAQAKSIVLTVARLDSAKGHQYLLRAAAMLPNVAFLLAGDGPLRATLETQARALGLDERIAFLGNRDDIPSLLAGCDLLALPSVNEGLPLVILEAMAAGRPVVATDVGGVGEAVDDGTTGVLVPAADPTRLARAIRAVLEDPLRAERLGTAGRSRARREFTAETMVARTVAVYEELLQSRART